MKLIASAVAALLIGFAAMASAVAAPLMPKNGVATPDSTSPVQDVKERRRRGSKRRRGGNKRRRGGNKRGRRRRSYRRRPRNWRQRGCVSAGPVYWCFD